MQIVKKMLSIAAATALVFTAGNGAVKAEEANACIGNSGPVTGPAAFGGKAIRMGAELAVEEINAAGGVLGQELEFIQYDDAGAPPRGVDNVRRIGLSDNCVAMIGGYHSTVALAQRDPIHEIGMPYVGTIAANTKVIENGRDPNFMFRVSAKDRWVTKFLVAEGIKRSANDRIGIMYENTGWGKGAFPDLQAALGEHGLEEVGAETFNWKDTDMTPQLIRFARCRSGSSHHVGTGPRRKPDLAEPPEDRLVAGSDWRLGVCRQSGRTRWRPCQLCSDHADLFMDG